MELELLQCLVQTTINHICTYMPNEEEGSSYDLRIRNNLANVNARGLEMDGIMIKNTQLDS